GADAVDQQHDHPKLFPYTTLFRSTKTRAVKPKTEPTDRSNSPEVMSIAWPMAIRPSQEISRSRVGTLSSQTLGRIAAKVTNRPRQPRMAMDSAGGVKERCMGFPFRKAPSVQATVHEARGHEEADEDQADEGHIPGG